MMTSPAYVFDSWGPRKGEKTFVVMCDIHIGPITTKHNQAEAQLVADAHNECFHTGKPVVLFTPDEAVAA
jgi:hypothetical protein